MELPDGKVRQGQFIDDKFVGPIKKEIEIQVGNASIKPEPVKQPPPVPQLALSPNNKKGSKGCDLAQDRIE